MTTTQQMTSCDLIMKGGISSGVVYPKAISAIFRQRSLQRVAGSSAGAIAAGLAAAAEYGRSSQGLDGRAEKLDALGHDLAKSGRVRDFFSSAPGQSEIPSEPQADQRAQQNDDDVWNRWSVEPAIDVLVAVASGKGFLNRAVAGSLFRLAGRRLFRRLFDTLAGTQSGRLERLLQGVRAGVTSTSEYQAQFDRIAFVCCAVSLLLILTVVALVLSLAPGWFATLLLLLLFTVLSVFGVGAYGLWSMSAWLSERDESLFGLSSGRHLVDWIEKGLEDLAGKTTVVTFADLEDAGIELRLFTSNLSEERPVLLPLRSEDEVYDREALFFARTRDLQTLTPPSVLSYLEAQAQDKVEHRTEGLRWDHRMIPIRLDATLPVSFGVRMSLSYPGLLSGVRLYEYIGPRPASGVEIKSFNDPRLREVWFSDGGIARNFPVDVFDKWVPSHPTYAIDLEDSELSRTVPAVPDPDQAGEPSNEVAPTSDQCRVVLPKAKDLSRVLPQAKPIEGFPGFLWSMFSLARNHADRDAARRTGARERICTVYLERHEGGLNLNMPDDVVKGLLGRGQRAGDALLNMREHEHYWVRARGLLEHLHELAEELSAANPKLSARLKRIKSQSDWADYYASAGVDLDELIEVAEVIEKDMNAWIQRTQLHNLRRGSSNPEVLFPLGRLRVGSARGRPAAESRSTPPKHAKAEPA